MYCVSTLKNRQLYLYPTATFKQPMPKKSDTLLLLIFFSTFNRSTFNFFSYLCKLLYIYRWY